MISTLLHASLYIKNKEDKLIIFHPDASFEMNIIKFWKLTKKTMMV